MVKWMYNYQAFISVFCSFWFFNVDFVLYFSIMFWKWENTTVEKVVECNKTLNSFLVFFPYEHLIFNPTFTGCTCEHPKPCDWNWEINPMTSEMAILELYCRLWIKPKVRYWCIGKHWLNILCFLFVQYSEDSGMNGNVGRCKEENTMVILALEVYLILTCVM